MIGCPACPRTWSTEETLAVHLIDTHDVAPAAAAVRARLIAHDQAKVDRHAASKATRQPATPSPDTRQGRGSHMVTCKTCQQPGHMSNNREFHPKPGTKPVGGGSRATKPRAAKKRRPITRRHPKPPKKAKVKGGRMDEMEIPALAAVIEALTPLEFDTKRRVLDYVCRRFTIDPAKLAA